MHKRSLETMVLSLPVMLQWEKGLDLIFETGILEAPIAIHTEWETISCLFLGCLIGHRGRRPQESLLPMSSALMRGVYRLQVMQAFALKAQRVLSITPILTIIKSRPWQTPQMIKTPLTVDSREIHRSEEHT